MRGREGKVVEEGRGRHASVVDLDLLAVEG